MNHLFLSDVHIGAFEEDLDRVIRRDLISLIEYCAALKIQIHILGDLFDYWMEYPSWKPGFGTDVLKTLQNYTRNVAPVNFITGNHDNWTYGYFDKLGFNVNKEFFDITLNNKRFFLHHGDGLKDPGYNLQRPFMHRLLRNKMFVKMYQLFLPPKTGIQLMKAFSDFSKQRAYCNPSVLDNWSRNFLLKTEYDVVISGHDHQPRILYFDDNAYINLGAFFKDRTVAFYNNGKLDLVVWNAAQKILLPFEQSYKQAAAL